MTHDHYAVYNSPTLIEIRNQDDCTVAYIVSVNETHRNGWQVKPMHASRTSNQTTYPSLEEAIASTRFMTKIEAREALDAANPVKVAEAHGAKLHRSDDGLWSILDHGHTPLWCAVFRSKEYAAISYCLHHALKLKPTPDPSETPSHDSAP